MKKVLIAGATGYLGKYVVKRFKNQGYYVRALARNESRLDEISQFIDETCFGEVTKPESIRGICRDMDIVFSSIGITKQKDSLTYMDVDYQANMNLLAEAQKAGVTKFIYVSVFNADKLSKLKGIQAKLKFKEALKNSGIDYAIIYPNGFFSDMLEYLQMAKKGRGYVFGTGENKINPVHGEDLAKVCVQAATGKKKAIEVGGPEVFTHNEILALAFRTLGKKSKISSIPIWLRNILMKTIRILTPVKIHGPIEFFMTVLAEDMVAPKFGSHRLKDFYLKHVDKI